MSARNDRSAEPGRELDVRMRRWRRACSDRSAAPRLPDAEYWTVMTTTSPAVHVRHDGGCDRWSGEPYTADSWRHVSVYDATRACYIA